jgi:O-antigen/teichoic acid export membrane protein
MTGGLRLLASDSLIYGLSGVIARFLSVWLIPIYTRLFSPEDYGVLSLVQATVAVLAMLVVLALDNSAARWYWDTEDEADRKRTVASGAVCQLAVATVVAVALWAASDALAARVVGRADAGAYLRLLALTLPLGQLGGVVTNWLRMRRRAVATMVYTLGTSVLQIGSTLAFVVLWRQGLRGVYLGQVLTAVVSTVVAVALLRDWVSPAHFDARRLREMLRYALPLIPTGLAFWIVGFADRYFVQRFASTAEVGLYSVGSSVAGLIMLLTGAFQQAWGPFALSIHKAADARETYANAFLAYVTVTAVTAAGLALLAPEAIRLVATDHYVGASSVVGLLALGYAMVGLTYVAATGATITKATGPVGMAITLAAVLNLALNAVLVPRWGKVGSAVATLASQAVTPVYLFHRSQQLYRIPYRFAAGAAIYALALGLIGVGLALPLRGPAAVAAKLCLLALFLPLLGSFDLITRARTRAWLSAVRSHAR